MVDNIEKAFAAFWAIAFVCGVIWVGALIWGFVKLVNWVVTK